MSDGPARKPRYRIVDGMRMPMGFPAGSLESVSDLVSLEGDIFVVSYPKCGTTWLQYIVYLMMRRRALGPEERLNDVFPHLEDVGAAAFESMPWPRLIKTHLKPDRLPYSKHGRYLVIVRNPFDCAVSFYHHTRGFPRHYDFADGSFAAFFECFVAGEVDFGDYFDHLAAWLAMADRANVLLLTYESLTRDTGREVRRTADFLGSEAAAAVATDTALERLIEEASLPSMRRDQQRWSSARPEGAPAFVRRGGVGDWQSLFTPSQARALLGKFERRLAGTRAARLWPEVLGQARRFAGQCSPVPR